jgi:pyrroloquinoline quinone (PQQ) biosynthesis protein C
VTLNLYKEDQSVTDPDFLEAVNKVSEVASFNRLNYFNKHNKEHKFRSTLREFTTLNQALKAWPALSKVVQEAWPEKMVTVHKKTERRAQEKKNKEMMDGVAQDLNTVILGGSLLED